MPPKDKAPAATPEVDEVAPASDVESAQGTPGEPTTSDVGGALVVDESGRYGIDLGDEGVLWLGHPQRYELPVRIVGE